MLPVDDARSLPLLYHLNSEPWLNIEAYTDPSNEVHFKQLGADVPSIELPSPANDSTFSELLRSRHSCRQFARRPLPLNLLSDLLANSYGILDVVPRPYGSWGCTRPVPSAGGLYPLEIYLAVAAVEGIADGVYHYNALHHRLESMTTGAVLDGIGDYLLQQHFLRNANVILFLSADLARTTKKYGPRGYRYVLLEAGHCAQNLCLLSSEQRLGVICIGGFLDGKLNRLINLDGTNEAVVYCVGIGYAVENSEQANS